MIRNGWEGWCISSSSIVVALESSSIGCSEGGGLVEDVNSGSSIETAVTGGISRITSETRMTSNK